MRSMQTLACMTCSDCQVSIPVIWLQWYPLCVGVLRWRKRLQLHHNAHNALWQRAQGAVTASYARKLGLWAEAPVVQTSQLKPAGVLHHPRI